jgi:hypothetical protein
MDASSSSCERNPLDITLLAERSTGWPKSYTASDSRDSNARNYPREAERAESVTAALSPTLRGGALITATPPEYRSGSDPD